MNYYPWVTATTYDADHDGYTADTDCNDNKASINPGAPEVCNGIDDNCNGQMDEGVLITYYRDADVDSFGNPSITSQGCSQPSGYVSNNTDCDDTNPLINPNTIWYPDADGDGYGNPSVAYPQCNTPTGPPGNFVLNNTDPDDSDPNIYPGAPYVRIDGTPPSYFLTLQEAYDYAGDGDTIQCLKGTFAEDLFIDFDQSITLNGGYNSDFTAITGETTLNGDLIISNGTITIENFILE